MATTTVNFESGTVGSSVTTTALGSGTGSGTGTYSNEQAAHGSKSMKIVQATAGRYLTVDWTSSSATRYFAFDIFLPAAPSASTTILMTYSGATTQGHLRMLTGRTIQLRNTASSQVALSTVALPLNQWSRVEFDCVPNGTGTVRIFAGNGALDSTTPTQTISGALGGTGTLSQALIGPSTAATWTTYWDNITMSDTAQPGPTATAQFQGWGLQL